MAKRANGEGSIIRHGSQWKAVIVIGYRDGKPIRRTQTCKSRKLARDAIVELKAKHLASGVSDRVTVRDFYAQWMAENERRLRNNSIVSYRRLMTNHILPRIGNRLIEELRPVDAMGLVNSLSADRIGTSTISHAIKAVRVMLNRAIQLQLCSTNPFVSVKLPKVQRKQIEPFTIDEVRQIIEHAPNTRLPGFWRLAFQTGMRFGEISALHWKDIDFAESTVHIHRMQSLQEDKTFAIEEVTKTSAGKRVVSLSEEVLHDLNEQRKHNMIVGRSSSPLVFPSGTLKAISPQSHHRYDWKPLLEQLGIRHRGFHHVRHTFATHALAAGIEITTVSKMLGHANSKVTLEKYAHAIPQRQREAVSKIREMFG